MPVIIASRTRREAMITAMVSCVQPLGVQLT